MPDTDAPIALVGHHRVEAEPLRVQVHRALEQLIVDGKLQPGRRLVETELAVQLGMSRGPIREALQMLAREGWVELRPRQGAYVAEPTLGEIVDYFDVRTLLEVRAARLAATNVRVGLDSEQRELLDELDGIVTRFSGRWHEVQARIATRDTSDEDEARQFHRKGPQRFHHTIARLAGNIAITDLLDRVSKRTRWYFTSRVLERTEHAWKEHDGIRNAIAAGDHEAAGDLMRAHMQATRANYLQLYDAGGGRA